MNHYIISSIVRLKYYFFIQCLCNFQFICCTNIFSLFSLSLSLYLSPSLSLSFSLSLSSSIRQLLPATLRQTSLASISIYLSLSPSIFLFHLCTFYVCFCLPNFLKLALTLGIYSFYIFTTNKIYTYKYKHAYISIKKYLSY